jgi:hypothetical protein
MVIESMLYCVRTDPFYRAAHPTVVQPTTVDDWGTISSGLLLVARISLRDNQGLRIDPG